MTASVSLMRASGRLARHCFGSVHRRYSFRVTVIPAFRRTPMHGSSVGPLSRGPSTSVVVTSVPAGAVTPAERPRRSAAGPIERRLRRPNVPCEPAAWPGPTGTAALPQPPLVLTRLKCLEQEERHEHLGTDR